MIEALKNQIANIGIHARKNCSLAERQEILAEFKAEVSKLEANIERIHAGPKHGLLAFVGKTPEEIEQIKRELAVSSGDPEDAA